MKDEVSIEFLRKINEDIPDIDRKRFNALHKHRNTLSEDEHEEFLQLIQLIEQKDAERIWYIAELAELRVVPINAVMDNLEIFQSIGKHSPKID